MYNAVDNYYFMQRLWFLLDKHNTPPVVGEDQMINFDDFLKVDAQAGEKCKLVDQC